MGDVLRGALRHLRHIPFLDMAEKSGAGRRRLDRAGKKVRERERKQERNR